MSEEFNFRDWASQGVKGARSKVHLPKPHILPQEFRDHMKSSRKEFLLAFRSLVDQALQHMDESKGARSRGSTIKPE